MAITSLTTYKTMLANPSFEQALTKTGLSTTAAFKWASSWISSPQVGIVAPVAPTTAVALNSASAGSMGQPDATGGNNLRLINLAMQNSVCACYMINDRLSQQGGLDATVTTAQSTNFPTAALTRYTNGVGVWACAEIYTQVGITGTTFTATYVADSGGTHTTQPVPIGASGFRETPRILLFNLAQGDQGVKSVSDLTVLATTGTAGAFGVTLFKPLLAFPTPGSTLLYEWDALIGLGGNIPIIQPGACLYWTFMSVAGSSGTLMYEASFAEDI